MKDDKRNSKEVETKSNLLKVSRKRWFYPALYLCVAALVMSGVLWMEKGIGGSQKAAPNKQTQSHKVTSNDNSQDAVPVNTTTEVLKWPVADKGSVQIGQMYYDSNASADAQVAALVNYDNSYAPNTGINLVANDKKSFDVTAAMSGTVLRAEKDALLGYVVELQHGNGVTTLYESLASLDVQKGDQVIQDQLLGTAGTDKYNKNMGTHLHFEVRKNNVPVNPATYWNKETSTIKSNTTATTAKSSSASSTSGNNMNSTSSSSMDNQTSGNTSQNSKSTNTTKSGFSSGN